MVEGTGSGAISKNQRDEVHFRNMDFAPTIGLGAGDMKVNKELHAIYPTRLLFMQCAKTAVSRVP